MKKFLLMMLAVVVMVGCQNQSSDKDNLKNGTHREKRNAQELLGQEYLKQAREYLADKEFEAARAEID